MGVGLEALSADSDTLQQVVGTGQSPSCAAVRAMGAKGVQQVSAGAEQGIQPSHWVLKDQPSGMAPELTELRALQLARVLPGQL